MPKFKTPGVFIEEVSTRLPSITDVKTAVPGFVGYTARARKRRDNDLILQPVRITSVAEFERHFGGGAFEKITLHVADSGTGGFITSALDAPDPQYILWYAIRLFFENGGTECNVVSVGLHQSSPVISLQGDGGDTPETGHGLLDGLETLKGQDEVTLIVIPEAIRLSASENSALVQAALLQCAALSDRFAIFDLYNGEKSLNDSALSASREQFGSANLSYGAAYYPYLRTTLTYAIDGNGDNVTVVYRNKKTRLSTLKRSNSSLYNYALNEVRRATIVMPPSPAVAGIYAKTDNARGVWKAPANVAVAGGVDPVVVIDDQLQAVLTEDSINGKSINAIRSFAGKGTLLWGARTLAGNDNEWRYVSVRRFLMAVEESIRKSTQWVVLEPNDANTWAKLTQVVENYLLQKWRAGALQGTTSRDAFFVKCGLGETMTTQDILDGRLKVEIGMAVVRPAEFIVISYLMNMRSD